MTSIEQCIADCAKADPSSFTHTFADLEYARLRAIEAAAKALWHAYKHETILPVMNAINAVGAAVDKESRG